MNSLDEGKDPYGEIAEKLRKQYQEDIDSDVTETKLSDGVASLRRKNSLFRRLSYTWKQDNKAILSQIKAASDGMIGDVFESTLAALDDLYVMVRKPAVNSNGILLKDERGRIIWELDRKGNPKEDWSLLTGQDIEETLLKLSREQIILSQRVSDLLLEATFAKHIADDSWNSFYEGYMDGTQTDKSARASRESQSERYQAFFRYFLWSKADALQRETRQVVRILERIREWRIRRGED